MTKWLLMTSLMAVACAPETNLFTQAGYVLGQSDQVLPYLLVDKGCFSDVKEPGGRVVKTQLELNSVLKDVTGHSLLKPQVDFEKEMVVFVFAGELPTAGYELQLAGVEETADKLLVKGHVLPPAAGRPVAQVILSPYLVFKMPVTDKPVQWEITGAVGMPQPE